MPRTFDGSDDEIGFSRGAADTATYGSVIVVAKRDTNNSYHCLFGRQNSDGSEAMEFFIANDNYLALWNGSVTKRAQFTVTAAEGWCLLGLTKTTGSTDARFHKYVYSTNSWTHSNTNQGTMNNWSTAGAGGKLTLGAVAGVDYFDGDIALAAFWDGTVLTDAQVELCAYSLPALLSLAPSAAWILDQSSTSAKIPDITGGGANETSITGTSVGTSSLPTFSYGAPVLPSLVVPGGGGGGTVEFAATLAGTSTVTAALDLTRALAAALAGTNTTTVVLNVIRALAAASSGTSTLNATLAVARALGVTAQGSNTLSAVLSVARSLATTIEGTNTLAAALARTITLAATMTGSSTLTASLVNQLNLQATMTGANTLTAGLSVSRGLAATLAGTNTLSANLAIDGVSTTSKKKRPLLVKVW